MSGRENSFGIGSSYSAAAALLQTFKELSNCLPHFHTSGETFPFHPDEPDKLEAFVERNDEVLSGSADSIHEQTFNVAFHRVELGVLNCNFFPGFQSEQRFHRAGRARVNRHDTIQSAVPEQERDSYWNHHGVPLAVRHSEVAQGLHAARNAAIVLPWIAEENGTSVTDTRQLSICLLEQVLVCFRQMCVAEIAELRRGW